MAAPPPASAPAPKNVPTHLTQERKNRYDDLMRRREEILRGDPTKGQRPIADPATSLLYSWGTPNWTWLLAPAQALIRPDMMSDNGEGLDWKKAWPYLFSGLPGGGVVLYGLAAAERAAGRANYAAGQGGDADRQERIRQLGLIDVERRALTFETNGYTTYSDSLAERMTKMRDWSLARGDAASVSGPYSEMLAEVYRNRAAATAAAQGEISDLRRRLEIPDTVKLPTSIGADGKIGIDRAAVKSAVMYDLLDRKMQENGLGSWAGYRTTYARSRGYIDWAQVPEHEKFALEQKAERLRDEASEEADEKIKSVYQLHRGYALVDYDSEDTTKWISKLPSPALRTLFAVLAPVTAVTDTPTAREFQSERTSDWLFRFLGAVSAAVVAGPKAWEKTDGPRYFSEVMLGRDGENPVWSRATAAHGLMSEALRMAFWQRPEAAEEYVRQIRRNPFIAEHLFNEIIRLGEAGDADPTLTKAMAFVYGSVGLVTDFTAPDPLSASLAVVGGMLRATGGAGKDAQRIAVLVSDLADSASDYDDFVSKLYKVDPAAATLVEHTVAAEMEMNASVSGRINDIAVQRDRALDRIRQLEADPRIKTMSEIVKREVEARVAAGQDIPPEMELMAELIRNRRFTAAADLAQAELRQEAAVRLLDEYRKGAEGAAARKLQGEIKRYRESLKNLQEAEDEYAKLAGKEPAFMSQYSPLIDDISDAITEEKTLKSAQKTATETLASMDKDADLARDAALAAGKTLDEFENSTPFMQYAAKRVKVSDNLKSINAELANTTARRIKYQNDLKALSKTVDAGWLDDLRVARRNRSQWKAIIDKREANFLRRKIDPTGDAAEAYTQEVARLKEQIEGLDRVRQDTLGAVRESEDVKRVYDRLMSRKDKAAELAAAAVEWKDIAKRFASDLLAGAGAFARWSDEVESPVFADVLGTAFLSEETLEARRLLLGDNAPGLFMRDVPPVGGKPEPVLPAGVSQSLSQVDAEVATLLDEAYRWFQQLQTHLRATGRENSVLSAADRLKADKESVERWAAKLASPAEYIADRKAVLGRARQAMAGGGKHFWSKETIARLEREVAALESGDLSPIENTLRSLQDSLKRHEAGLLREQALVEKLSDVRGKLAERGVVLPEKLPDLSSKQVVVADGPEELARDKRWADRRKEWEASRPPSEEAPSAPATQPGKGGLETSYKEANPASVQPELDSILDSRLEPADKPAPFGGGTWWTNRESVNLAIETVRGKLAEAEKAGDEGVIAVVRARLEALEGKRRQMEALAEAAPGVVGENALAWAVRRAVATADEISGTTKNVREAIEEVYSHIGSKIRVEDGRRIQEAVQVFIRDTIVRTGLFTSSRPLAIHVRLSDDPTRYMFIGENLKDPISVFYHELSHAFLGGLPVADQRAFLAAYVDAMRSIGTAAEGERAALMGNVGAEYAVNVQRATDTLDMMKLKSGDDVAKLSPDDVLDLIYTSDVQEFYAYNAIPYFERASADMLRGPVVERVKELLTTAVETLKTTMTRIIDAVMGGGRELPADARFRVHQEVKRTIEGVLEGRISLNFRREGGGLSEMVDVTATQRANAIQDRGGVWIDTGRQVRDPYSPDGYAIVEDFVNPLSRDLKIALGNLDEIPPTTRARWEESPIVMREELWSQVLTGTPMEGASVESLLSQRQFSRQKEVLSVFRRGPMEPGVAMEAIDDATETIYEWHTLESSLKGRPPLPKEVVRTLVEEYAADVMEFEGEIAKIENSDDLAPAAVKRVLMETMRAALGGVKVRQGKKLAPLLDRIALHVGEAARMDDGVLGWAEIRDGGFINIAVDSGAENPLAVLSHELIHALTLSADPHMLQGVVDDYVRLLRQLSGEFNGRVDLRAILGERLLDSGWTVEGALADIDLFGKQTLDPEMVVGTEHFQEFIAYLCMDGFSARLAERAAESNAMARAELRGLRPDYNELFPPAPVSKAALPWLRRMAEAATELFDTAVRLIFATRKRPLPKSDPAQVVTRARRKTMEVLESLLNGELVLPDSSPGNIYYMRKVKAEQVSDAATLTREDLAEYAQTLSARGIDIGSVSSHLSLDWVIPLMYRSPEDAAERFAGEKGKELLNKGVEAARAFMDEQLSSAILVAERVADWGNPPYWTEGANVYRFFRENGYPMDLLGWNRAKTAWEGEYVRFVEQETEAFGGKLDDDIAQILTDELNLGRGMFEDLRKSFNRAEEAREKMIHRAGMDKWNGTTYGSAEAMGPVTSDPLVSFLRSIHGNVEEQAAKAYARHLGAEGTSRMSGETSGRATAYAREAGVKSGTVPFRPTPQQQIDALTGEDPDSLLAVQNEARALLEADQGNSVVRWLDESDLGSGDTASLYTGFADDLFHALRDSTVPHETEFRKFLDRVQEGNAPPAADIFRAISKFVSEEAGALLKYLEARKEAVSFMDITRSADRHDLGFKMFSGISPDEETGFGDIHRKLYRYIKEKTHLYGEAWEPPGSKTLISQSSWASDERIVFQDIPEGVVVEIDGTTSRIWMPSNLDGAYDTMRLLSSSGFDESAVFPETVHISVLGVPDWSTRLTHTLQRAAAGLRPRKETAKAISELSRGKADVSAWRTFLENVSKGSDPTDELLVRRLLLFDNMNGDNKVLFSTGRKKGRTKKEVRRLFMKAAPPEPVAMQNRRAEIAAAENAARLFAAPARKQLVSVLDGPAVIRDLLYQSGLAIRGDRSLPKIEIRVNKALTKTGTGTTYAESAFAIPSALTRNDDGSWVIEVLDETAGTEDIIRHVATALVESRYVDLADMHHVMRGLSKSDIRWKWAVSPGGKAEKLAIEKAADAALREFSGEYSEKLAKYNDLRMWETESAEDAALAGRFGRKEMEERLAAREARLKSYLPEDMGKAVKEEVARMEAAQVTARNLRAWLQRTPDSGLSEKVVNRFVKQDMQVVMRDWVARENFYSLLEQVREAAVAHSMQRGTGTEWISARTLGERFSDMLSGPSAREEGRLWGAAAEAITYRAVKAAAIRDTEMALKGEKGLTSVHSSRYLGLAEQPNRRRFYMKNGKLKPIGEDLYHPNRVKPGAKAVTAPGLMRRTLIAQYGEAAYDALIDMLRGEVHPIERAQLTGLETILRKLFKDEIEAPSLTHMAGFRDDPASWAATGMKLDMAEVAVLQQQLPALMRSLKWNSSPDNDMLQLFRAWKTMREQDFALRPRVLSADGILHAELRNLPGSIKAYVEAFRRWSNPLVQRAGVDMTPEATQVITSAVNTSAHIDDEMMMLVDGIVKNDLSPDFLAMICSRLGVVMDGKTGYWGWFDDYSQIGMTQNDRKILQIAALVKYIDSTESIVLGARGKSTIVNTASNVSMWESGRTQMLADARNLKKSGWKVDPASSGSAGSSEYSGAFIAFSRAWMPSKPLENQEVHVRALAERALEILEENHRNGGTFLDAVLAMKKATASRIRETEYGVSRAFGFSARAVGHAFVLQGAAEGIQRMATSRMTPEVATSVQRLVSGNFAFLKPEGLRMAIQALNDIGQPVGQTSARTVRKTGEIGKTTLKAISIGGNPGGEEVWTSAALLKEIEENLPAIIKETHAHHADPNIPVSDMLMRQGIGRFTSWWKTSAVTGLLIPNPRYFLNNVFGDFSQIWFSRGLLEATRLSFQNLPNNVPLLGPAFTDWGSQFALRMGRTPGLGSVTNALFNPWLHAVWNNEQEVLRGATGQILPVRDLRAWMVEDGILDTFVHEELQRAFTRVKPNWFNDSLPVRGAQRMQESINQFATFIQQRQRAALYLELLQNGATRSEARRITLEALFDWKNGVAQYELASWQNYIPFYRFWSLAMNQMATAVIDPLVRPAEQFGRSLYGDTKLGRTRNMHTAYDRAFGATHAAVREALAEEYNEQEQEKLAIMQYTADPWLRQKGANLPFSLSESDTRFFQRTRGLDKVYDAAYLSMPRLTTMDTLPLMLTIPTLTFQGFQGVITGKGFVPGWHEPHWNGIAGMMSPWLSEPMGQMYSNLISETGGKGSPVVRVNEAEAAALNSLPTLVGDLARQDPQTGEWKAPAAALIGLRLTPFVGIQMLPMIDAAYTGNPASGSAKIHLVEASSLYDQSRELRLVGQEEEADKLVSQAWAQVKAASRDIPWAVTWFSLRQMGLGPYPASLGQQLARRQAEYEGILQSIHKQTDPDFSGWRTNSRDVDPAE